MTVATYFQPTSVAEALALLGEHGPELLVMAGGTVVMPLVNEGISLPGKVMGLRRAGLDTIGRTDAGPDDGPGLDADPGAGPVAGTRIGAMVTLTQLTTLADIPLLAEAARRTAAWAVRNMGTIGGNLFTPPPGGDIAVALLALDARIVIAGPAGERTVDLKDFHTGFMTTVVGLDELVVAVLVPPRPTGERTAFVKFGRRHANTPAVVTVAARARMDHDGIARDVRLALGAAGPHPLRAHAAEELLEGRRLDAEAIAGAAEAAANESEPVTDAVASEWYRRRMTGVITGRALEQLASPVERGA